MPTLVVDEREPDDLQTIIYARLEGQDDWKVNRATLAAGDYVVGKEKEEDSKGKLGIERKTPEDFLSSFSSERLKKQCKELKDNYEIAVLLITGDPSEVITPRHRGYTPAAVIGMLSSLTVRTGVVPLFTGREHGMDFIEALAKKAVDGKTVPYNPIRRAPTVEEERINVLTALPGIGVERAKAILAKYGTLLVALNHYDFWPAEVSGIGEKTVEQVKRVFAE